jgi:carboxyl-terminal processing protease
MRKHLMLPGAAAGIALAVAAIQTNAAADEPSQRDRLLAAFDRILGNYVDDLDESELVTAAINGMTNVLDSQSRYINNKKFKDMQINARGTAGLGVLIAMDKGTVRVITPLDGSGAAKAGVMANDVITHIDGMSVQGLKSFEIFEKMNGSANTSVRLTVMRAGDEKPVELTALRRFIAVRPVRIRQEGDDIGYIRISLHEATMPNLADAIAEWRNRLPSDKIKGYILDLRNTAGFQLDAAVSVADAFLEDGEIVAVRGRDPGRIERFNAQPGDSIDGKPLVVLINGGTAAGAEIIAGALQDHKRATIIGSRSFGKGSVQKILPLGPRNGALFLTTGRYFTPAGRPIDAAGIVPDIEAPQDFPQPPENDKALAWRVTYCAVSPPTQPFHRIDGNTPTR